LVRFVVAEPFGPNQRFPYTIRTSRVRGRNTIMPMYCLLELKYMIPQTPNAMEPRTYRVSLILKTTPNILKELASPEPVFVMVVGVVVVVDIPYSIVGF